MQTPPPRKEYPHIRAAARVRLISMSFTGLIHEKCQRDRAAKEYGRSEPESSAAGTPGDDARKESEDRRAAPQYRGASIHHREVAQIDRAAGLEGGRVLHQRDVERSGHI